MLAWTSTSSPESLTLLIFGVNAPISSTVIIFRMIYLVGISCPLRFYRRSKSLPRRAAHLKIGIYSLSIQLCRNERLNLEIQWFFFASSVNVNFPQSISQCIPTQKLTIVFFLKQQSSKIFSERSNFRVFDRCRSNIGKSREG